MCIRKQSTNRTEVAALSDRHDHLTLAEGFSVSQAEFEREHIADPNG